MFEIGFVIFREFLEISLILGIVVASMKPINSYLRLVATGIIFGILGSIFLGFLTYHMSANSEGIELQIINLCILLSAVFMIGWTIIWMQNYGKKIKASFFNMSNKVSSNEISSSIFIILIATTILREGAEMVIILYALTLSQKQEFWTYLYGFIIGSSMGVSVGIAIYFGLINIGIKYLFRISSFIMTFICAGLASEAAKSLTNMGILENFSKQIWDSSSIISDNQNLGHILKILIGYSAKPNLAQIIFYISTIIIIYSFSKFYSTKRNIISK